MTYPEDRLLSAKKGGASVEYILTQKLRQIQDKTGKTARQELGLTSELGHSTEFPWRQTNPSNQVLRLQLCRSVERMTVKRIVLTLS